MKKLHDLIHSLSQGEKRFVKIRLNGNKSTSLLKTYFELLNKQKTYSFDEINKTVKQTKKLTQSNLSLLYEVVLKHLQSHYSAKNIEFGFRGELSSVKILMDKGLFSEAKSLCKKLILKAHKKEEFAVLKSVYKEYWNIHLLNGELNEASNETIQAELNAVCEKESKIVRLEEMYRMVTTLYYDYFFKKRDQEYQNRVKQVTKTLESLDLNSDTAKHISFEIKSIKSVVLNDLGSHHSIRKKQLKHLMLSPVFESDHLLRLMVLSNTFTLLRSQARVKELSAYIAFMERHFKSMMDGGNDSVFAEKYYDIYFTNHCFIQAWESDGHRLNQLIISFKEIMSKGYITNPLIVGRIYLSLIELQITAGNYKEAGPLLTEFFSLSKKKKYSKHYMEGDLLFLVQNYLQGKIDTFDNALEAFNRKVRRNELELDPDQKALLALLNDLFKETARDIRYYIARLSNKQTYKLFVYKLLSSHSFEEIRSEKFPINDVDYSRNSDVYLSDLNEIV